MEEPKEEIVLNENIADIFEESIEEVFKTTNSTVVAPTITENSLDIGGEGVTPVQARNWNELQVAFATGHTERFNRVMNELPDREFARIYVKIAPFFKEKATRHNSPKGPTVLNQITINVHRNSKDKNDEQRIIEIPT